MMLHSTRRREKGRFICLRLYVPDLTGLEGNIVERRPLRAFAFLDGVADRTEEGVGANKRHHIAAPPTNTTVSVPRTSLKLSTSVGESVNSYEIYILYTQICSGCF